MGAAKTHTRVLLTDAEERAALAAGRCLKAAGYEVSYAASRFPAPAFWSRSADRDHVHRVPDPRAAPRAFVAELTSILRTDEHATVLPGGDASLRAISAHREQLEPWVELGLPPHDKLELAMSKAGLAAAARASGLSAPETVECRGRREARAAARAFGYPVAVKPPASVVAVEPPASSVSTDVSQRQLSSVVAFDEQAVDRFVEACGGHCLIQRNVTGPVYSFFGVRACDQLLAYGLSRYRRTWPTRGGNVSSAVTVRPPAGLTAAVHALVSELGWQGVFELELIRDGTGRFMPIDLNPRVYGSLALAVRAGAPLPAIWCDWRLGRRRAGAGIAVARAGVNYRWEDSEMRHLLWQLRRGQLRAAAGVLRPRRHTVHAHLHWRDPAPLVARAVFVARPKAGRGASSVHTNAGRRASSAHTKAGRGANGAPSTDRGVTPRRTEIENPTRTAEAST